MKEFRIMLERGDIPNYTPGGRNQGKGHWRELGSMTSEEGYLYGAIARLMLRSAAKLYTRTPII